MIWTYLRTLRILRDHAYADQILASLLITPQSRLTCVQSLISTLSTQFLVRHPFRIPWPHTLVCEFLRIVVTRRYPPCANPTVLSLSMSSSSCNLRLLHLALRSIPH